MDKKEAVIIVPGSKYLKPKTKISQQLILFFYRLTRVFKPVYNNYVIEWKHNFDKKNREVIWLHWNRGISVISVFFAVQKLKRLIKHLNGKHKIKLIGISLGGEIVLETAKSFDDGTIDKIILVCSTNEHTKLNFKNINTVNIYSDYDLFAKLSTKVLSPLQGGTKISGSKTKNIMIPKFTHSDFCADKKVCFGKYKGINITKVINRFL